MSFFDFDINFASTNDKQMTDHHYLEDSFEQEQNNFMENNFRTEMDNIFSFTNNSEIVNPNLDSIPFNLPNVQNIVIPLNSQNLFLIEEKSKTERPKLGRKRKDTNETGKHNKYKQDNMIRKLKAYLKRVLLDFINLKLKKANILSDIKINGKTYKDDEIRLLNINQEDVKDISCEKNRKILKETIREMFSVERSGNYSNYPPDFNIKLIEKLYEIENGEIVTSILDKTYLECLKYFRKEPKIICDPKYSCLSGLEKGFEKIREQFSKNHDEKYINSFIELIKNFEIIYYTKKERARRI